MTDEIKSGLLSLLCLINATIQIVLAVLTTGDSRTLHVICALLCFLLAQGENRVQRK